MIEFSLVQLNSDDSVLDILGGNLKCNTLPRKGDSLVFNDKKFDVCRVVFSFNDNICEKIIVMVKLFNETKTTKEQIKLNNNSNKFEEYGSIFI